MNKSALFENRKSHITSRILFKIGISLSILLLILFAIMFSVKNSNINIDDGHSYVPKNGFVPDKETATKIAELIAKKIYGDPRIDAQKPFQTDLKGEVWKVSGTIPPNFLGGTFEVYLSKVDGKIIRVTHGK